MQIRSLGFLYDELIDWSDHFAVPYDSDRQEDKPADIFKYDVAVAARYYPMEISRGHEHVNLSIVTTEPWSLVVADVAIEPAHGVLDLRVGIEPPHTGVRRLVGAWKHELVSPLVVRPAQRLFGSLRLPFGSEGHVAMRGLLVKNLSRGSHRG